MTVEKTWQQKGLEDRRNGARPEKAAREQSTTVKSHSLYVKKGPVNIKVKEK